MAIFHLRARTASRAGGASAAASAAYILRLGKYKKTGLDGCIFTQAGNMPDWASGPNKRLEYWRAADLYERANGRLFKSVEFALPTILSPAARFDLALQFCEQVARTTEGQPLPFLLAGHEGKGGNPHVHLMVSERINDGHNRSAETWFGRASTQGKDPARGGAKKSAALKPKDWLFQTRALLADLTNKALAKAGFSARVDHRSLLDQGITNRAPGQHLGPTASARLRRGVGSRRRDDLNSDDGPQRNREIDDEARQVKRELISLGWSPKPTPHPVPIQSNSIQKRSNSNEFESPSI